MTLYMVEYEKIIISFFLFFNQKNTPNDRKLTILYFCISNRKFEMHFIMENKFKMLRCQWFNGEWSKVRGVQERIKWENYRRAQFFFPISFDKKWFLFIVLSRNLSNLNLNNDFEALGDDMCYENTVVSRPLIMDKRCLIHVNLVFMTLQV